MIRLGLIYLGCVIAVILLVLQGPGLLWHRSAAPATVAAPAAAPAPEASADAPDAIAEAPAQPAPATGSAAVALAAAAAAAAAPEPPATQPVIRSGKASLDQTTAAILAELAIVKEQGDSGGDMLDMSASAISGLKGALGKGGDGVVTLEHLVADALREGQSDTAIDQAVNAAAAAGEVSVPAELVTPEGRVDTAVLLANLVTQAQIAAGIAQPVNPEDVVASGAGVEVHLVTKAGGASEQAQFYTVNPGDSLGSIAVKFYGDARYYPQIFEANRAILSSPDRLSVGQRLAIPAAASL